MEWCSTWTRSSSSVFSEELKSLRVVTFNIERGYCIDEIIPYLRSLHAHVILLQEVDIGCKRTDSRNIAQDIAEALDMHCVWGCEFEELDHSKRGQRLAGGGWHGNAVLSVFPLEAHGVWPHAVVPFASSVHVPWWALSGQPRRGGRVVVWADVRANVGGQTLTLRFYSLHLENNCDLVGRLLQMAEVLEHAALVGPDTRVVFGGDFNTLMHGFARFAPWQPGSILRFSTFGVSEAGWWQQNILESRQTCLSTLENVPALGTDERANKYLPSFSRWYDPFRKCDDPTHYRWPFWQAKLDWLLLEKSRMRAIHQELGGEGLSDHLCVVVDIEPIFEPIAQ